MGKNPVVAVIAVIVLIVAVVLIVRGMSGPSSTGPAGQGTWYDTGSNTLYGGQKGVMPPAPAPSGSEGVMATVFAKGSCANKSDRFIGYLSKYTDEGKKLMAAAQAENPIDTAKIQGIMGEHRLVKREGDAEWVAQGSDEGQAIVEEAKAKGGTLCPRHLE